MKILKKIKLFLIKQRFKRNIQKKDNGLGYLDRIIIFEEQRPGHWFFSRSPFKRKLFRTLGKQINLEKIQHYILENRLGRKKYTSVWGYVDKRWVYFTPVGSKKIFLTTDNLVKLTKKKKGETVIMEDDRDRILDRRFIVAYELDSASEPLINAILIENTQNGDRRTLKTFNSPLYINYVREIIAEWKKLN